MKATPAITALSAQINHASGLPLNRAQRRAAKRRRPHQVKQIDDLAGLRLLDHSRPYEPGEMVDVRKIEAALGIGRRKPLTNREIGLLWVDCVPDDIDTDPKKAAVQLLMAAVGLARAVEAALGIGANP